MDNLIDTQKISKRTNIPAREPKWSWKNVKKTLGKAYAFFYGNPPAIIGTFLLTIVLAGALFAPVLSTHNPESVLRARMKHQVLNILWAQLVVDETCIAKFFLGRESH